MQLAQKYDVVYVENAENTLKHNFFVHNLCEKSAKNRVFIFSENLYRRKTVMKRVFSILMAVLISATCLGVAVSAENAADLVNAKAALDGVAKNKANTSAVYGKVTYNEIATYDQYLEANSKIANGKENVTVLADKVTKKTEGVKIEKGSKYKSNAGFNFKQVVYTDETDNVTFKFNMKKDGKYNIKVKYFTVKGKDINIVRDLKINGETPYTNVAQCTFTRNFVDNFVKKSDGKLGFHQDYLGNDIRPDQKEVFIWKESYINDYLGYNNDPLQFCFKKGENTLTFEAVKEPMVIGSIEIVPIKSVDSYETYLSKHKDAKKYSGDEKIMEAEFATDKTDKTLYPSADVSTASTSTYGKNTSAYTQSVNMTGGTNWQYMQQAISWTVADDVKPGFYSLNFKYRQNVNDGMRSPRRLYINNETPFKEAKALEFNYTADWAMYCPQKANGEECLVYLEPGYVITLETTLSKMGKFLQIANETLNEINEIYRQIIKITGTEPDQNRDYQLDELIPDEVKGLGKCAKVLQSIVDGIEKYTGESSSGLSTLNTLIRQMTKMTNDSDKIGKELSYFKTNVSSLGTWINSASYVPLQIDYISLSAPNSDIKEPEVGFFESLGYSVNRFISSFTVDYNAIGNDKAVDENDDETITVWLATGRDQFQIVRQLINNTYTAQTGYQVNLELVNVGAVLSAVVAGIGPDVVLDQATTEPVNFALRHAAQDLKKFKDDKGTAGSDWDQSFDEVLNRFYSETLTPFYFDSVGEGKEEDTGLYALPEKQDFQVMFYRTDVLAAEGIDIPKTWGELVTTITALNKKNLEFGMPVSTSLVANNGTNVFYSMLRQMGGDMFVSDKKSTDLQTDAAIKAFKLWTNYYVNYDLPLSYDFKTRFRTGEMPLAIDSFTIYNTLAVSAPEINGRWGYTLVPGNERTDSNGNKYIDHSTTVFNNCALIISSNNTNLDLSWKFLKWWTSTPTQASFGNQIESVLGASARYNTANLNAFEQLPWAAKEKNVLNDQLSWGKALPQIAGSYFIDRHINNAFRRVVYKDKDAKDTLYDYAQTINAEITKKRQEFGLPVLKEE